MARLYIIGTSTTAMTVAAFARTHKLFDVAGFAVDRAYISSSPATCMDLPVFAIDELKGIMDPASDLIFVAIAWNRLNADRRDLYFRLKREGFRFANLVSPTATVYGELLGDNCWIADHAVVNFRSKLHNNVIIKEGAHISYDCDIADHCFIGAHSFIAGGVSVGEQSFVGIRATVFDDVRIGRKCIIGGATVVKRNMADFSKITVMAENFAMTHHSEQDMESKLMFNKNVR